MPRANRCFVAGAVWHITHRCHKQEFLLRHDWCRRRWLHWLFEARRRFDLCILNYTVTRNHIHLLVRDLGYGEIARSMQLTAGRTAQEFNTRKRRRGAFWEDRYHATAVSTDIHLARCLVYIDLNMVRAGAVSDPSDWPHSGYHEIQTPKKRYRIVDTNALMELTACRGQSDLRSWHRGLVDEALRDSDFLQRQSLWTESVAVGDRDFTAMIEQALGIRVPGRKLTQHDTATWILKQERSAYNAKRSPKRAANCLSSPLHA